ncbi:MAG: FeoA family protein [Halieaceae bacterium]
MVAESQTMNLWELPTRTEAVLVGFAPALAERYRGRLLEFGFHTGEKIVCQHQPGFGAPRVYRVSNATYSLDRELALQVLVSVARE